MGLFSCSAAKNQRALLALLQDRLLARVLAAHQLRDISLVAFNRRDYMRRECVGQDFGLSRVALNRLLVPSSEGRVHSVLASWGAGVVPQVRVQEVWIDQGLPVSLAPAHTLPIQSYWHCGNLESEVQGALAAALTASASRFLELQGSRS